jgi:hypothetical protein
MQTYGWFKPFKNGQMSVDVEECSGWPSTVTTTEKFDTEGIVHKECVPPGQIWMENSIAKFWFDWGQNIRQVME